MTASTPNQLTLGVSLDDNATFANFLVAARNEQAVNCVADSSQAQKLVALWGGHDAGLTHLLQAACHQRAVENRNSLYISMADKHKLHPDILTGVQTLALLCIDDIQHIAGDPQWEAALFTAFNAIADSPTQLILAGDRSPGSLAIELPDLQSRLQLCLVFQLSGLNDAEKRQALKLRAANRGIELTDAVVDYILLRGDRSLKGLMATLDKLDDSSLSQQRRLTIPLVKSTMGW